jgi:hypothetical protein
MRRARRPAPLRLAGLTYNARSGTYEVLEDGILYSMDLELTRQLKDYFKWFHPNEAKHRNLAAWYRSLSKEDRARVYRSGALPPQRSDFFPDPDYDQ